MPQTNTPATSVGCQFFPGMRCFCSSSGIFIGVVVSVEWDTGNSDYVLTLDPMNAEERDLFGADGMWYFGRELDLLDTASPLADEGIVWGQRVGGFPLFENAKGPSDWDNLTEDQWQRIQGMLV